MSDGGKGSSPRPYSVSQDVFENNWERIFGKKKSEFTDKKPDCHCYNCNKNYVASGELLPYVMGRMILCPKCGNKRCPHSTDHSFECTGSNEPGQTGSRY